MNFYEAAQELADKFTDPILIGGIAAIESGFTELTTNDIDAKTSPAHSSNEGAIPIPGAWAKELTGR